MNTTMSSPETAHAIIEELKAELARVKADLAAANAAARSHRIWREETRRQAESLLHTINHT